MNRQGSTSYEHASSTTHGEWCGVASRRRSETRRQDWLFDVAFRSASTQKLTGAFGWSGNHRAGLTMDWGATCRFAPIPDFHVGLNCVLDHGSEHGGVIKSLPWFRQPVLCGV